MSKLQSFDVLVVGAGVSGLTAAKKCKSLGLSVAVLEQDNKAGGLVRCERINGSLHHLVGGHVFNTKIPAIRDFFWDTACNKTDFSAMNRNAKILLEDRTINYPIENHIFELDEADAASAINDLVSSAITQGVEPETFRDFLYKRFGKTLCEVYFFPYNEKIWQKDLNNIALDWLVDKLPMTTINEILIANIVRKSSSAKMVHDTFFYPTNNGSQHIVDSLMKDVTVITNEPVNSIEFSHEHKLTVNSHYRTEHIIYTGDIRKLPDLIGSTRFESKILDELQRLEGHGTTNVLFSCEPNQTSWMYLPSRSTKAHRIINTGLFAATNTAEALRSRGLSTSIVEFSGHLSKEEAFSEASKMPGFHEAISYNYREMTYIIHDNITRQVVEYMRKQLKTMNILLVGRFAEWEYYNMDTAMYAAFQTAEGILRKPRM